MPHCINCGNELTFGTSRIPPIAPTANGPISGLVADFTEESTVKNMECMGASIDEAQEAWENPKKFFDICYNCGSTDIKW